MKNAVKWILTAVLLIGIIVGASVLYNKFSKEYGGGNLIENTESNTEKNSATEASTTETTASEASETTASGTTESTASETENSDPDSELMDAPDFTVLDYEGNEVKLSDYRGKPVVINFWATWCYYCKVEMPDFNTAYLKYPEVQFLMINATDGVQETIESAKKYIEEEQFEFGVFFDTELEAVNAYYVTGFPTTFFIDKDGKLVAQGSGMLDYETLEKGIKMITE